MVKPDIILKAYRLCRIKGGELYPLFVLANEPLPMGIWLEAKEGPRDGDKVKSKLGRLAYRPGFHLAPIPNAPWIGKKENGELLMRSDTVWVEVEYLANICYGAEARENGWRAGRWAASRAYIRHIPVNGYYKYRTNSKGDTWIICGNMRIIRILSDEERIRLCLEAGVIPQRREIA